MVELTLNVGDMLFIGGEVILTILEKSHPKAIPAQMVRIGIQAPNHISINRLEKTKDHLLRRA